MKRIREKRKMTSVSVYNKTSPVGAKFTSPYLAPWLAGLPIGMHPETPPGARTRQRCWYPTNRHESQPLVLARGGVRGRGGRGPGSAFRAGRDANLGRGDPH